MPVPVLAGLPWLAGILGGLFASLVAWFAQFLTKRLAILVAVVLAIGALTATFFSAMQALVSGLSAALPAAVTTGMGLLLPSNTILCLTAVVSAYTVRYVYAWNVRIIQYKLL